MNNTNKIENLNELLGITWMEDIIQSPNEENIFAEEVKVNMPAKKRTEMIDKLFALASQPSFGELLINKLAGQNETAVLEKTELSQGMLSELKEDKIAVNNVPVFLLKNLLAELQISFSNGQSAIRKTFEMLRNRTVLASDELIVRPVFRKGMTDGSSEGFKRMPNKDLFENEESLNKYLNRLEKLMR